MPEPDHVEAAALGPETENDARDGGVGGEDAGGVVGIVSPDLDAEEEAPSPWAVVAGCEFFTKWAGVEGASSASMKRKWCEKFADSFFSGIGAFCGLLVVYSITAHTDVDAFMVPFGASAVLLYSAPDAPLSQPYNAFMGHFIATIIGISIRNIFDEDADWHYIMGPLSCALTITIQQIASAVHPPGGATAIVCATTKVTPRWAGFYFLLKPVLLGLVLLHIVGLISNNYPRRRRFPQFWIP
eukprot:Hpha_TRINITY_DN15460_c2_g6::TRINITY_DN15460_c2_g6_i1::g.176470::m.176470